MPRAKDKGVCCGAGGGRMFMEEKEGKRINLERAEEALATKADTIAVACPFCMTMMADGVKAQGSEVPVYDIAEVVAQQLAEEAVVSQVNPAVGSQPDHPDLPFKPPLPFLAAIVGGVGLHHLRPIRVRPVGWAPLGLALGPPRGARAHLGDARVPPQAHAALQPWKATRDRRRRTVRVCPNPSTSRSR